MIKVAQEQERAKIVQTELPSSYLISSPFITGLDPFEQMVLAATTVVPRQTGPKDNRTPWITAPGFYGTAPR